MQRHPSRTIAPLPPYSPASFPFAAIKSDLDTEGTLLFPPSLCCRGVNGGFNPPQPPQVVRHPKHIYIQDRERGGWMLIKQITLLSAGVSVL